MPVDRNKLSPRQTILVNTYFESNFNQFEAVRAAYPKISNPRSYSERAFKQPAVVKEIKRRMDKLGKKHDLTVDWLVDRLVKRITANEKLAKFVKVTEDGKLDYDFTGATEEEIALIAGFTSDVYIDGRGPDGKKVRKFKLEAISVDAAEDKLAKLLGWYIDKKEISGPNGGPIEIVDPKEIARKLAFMLASGSKETN